MEADRLGHSPPVVDSAEILKNPEGVLHRLCKSLGIVWDAAMLAWEKGPLVEDGIWGAHWYDKVNASTGFGPAHAKMPLLDAAYQKTADACRGDYEFMRNYAIKA